MSKSKSMALPQQSFAGRCWQRIKTSEYLYLTAAFFLPFMIMLGVYACMSIHPFGNSSVLTLDLQAQYVYYYEEIRSLLVNGGSWLYSWKRTLGGEFMGIVAYYMGSLYNVLLVLFPKENIVDAVMFIQLCKIGSMGVTFGYYLHRTRHLGEMRTLAFSVMYALCAFSVVQTIDPMWLDALIYLPLLILGTERLIRHRRCVLYIIALSLEFISNYYMGYMCGIFTFLYFCYYYATIRPELPLTEKKKGESALSRLVRSYGFRTFVRFAVATLIALAISAFMLYPAWYSLHFGKIGWLKTDLSPRLRFDFFDLFIKMLTGSYDSVNRQGRPMIYCGVLVLLLLPLFYTSKQIPKRQKISASVLLIVLIASFSCNTIDLVWHGFSMPNWLNYRYSYVFSFFVLTLAFDALKGIRTVKPSYIAGVGSAVVVLILLTQKMNIVFQQGDTKSIELSDAGCILLSFTLVIIYSIIVSLIRNKKLTEVAAFILAAFVCIEMFASALLTMAAVHVEVGETKYADTLDSNNKEVYSSYTGAIKRIQTTVDMVLDADKTFYRMESMVYRKAGGVNEPMAFGYNGISHSTSTLDADVIRMMNKLGYSSSSHWTKYLGGTPVSDALLGIKYVITENDLIDRNIFTVAAEAAEGYQQVVSTDTIYAMKNTKALSVAYGVSENVISDMALSTYTPYTSGMDYQNKLLSSMLSGTNVSGEVLKGISTGIETKDCSRSSFTQNHTYTRDGETYTVANNYYSFKKTGSNPTVIFDFTSPVTGPIYFHFTAANFGKTFKVYVNGAKLSDYFGTDTSCAMDLGTFNKGDQVTVELRMDNDDLYLSKESKYYFYYVDYSQMNAAFAKLQQAEMNVEKYSNTSLEGTITLPQGQTLVFTSIPYDEGWNVYIDGKKAETVEVMDSLLAVRSTEGYHEIEFKYMPAKFVLAFVISGITGAAFVAFLVLIVLMRLGKVKVKFLEGSPELPSASPDMIFPTVDVPEEDEQSEPETKPTKKK